jgi:hypothetical protein
MKRLTTCLTVLGVWVLASLLAIAYIGDHPYLGLAIALLGGIAFGVAAFLSYEEERRAGAEELGSRGVEEQRRFHPSTSAPLHLSTGSPPASTSIRRLAWWIVGLLAMAALALGYWAWTVRTAATVIVEWTTASELNTAGFNLYRRDSPDDPFSRLNEHLIPASPDPLLGGSYAFTDTNVVAGRTYYYQLEDVETSGATTRHGPIAAKAEGGGQVALLVLVLLVGAILGLGALFGLSRFRHQPARG